MRSQTHRLRRLHWQARAPDAAQAFALRALLRAGGEAVQAALDRELSRWAAPGETWCLPRLELHLDAVALDRLEADLPERVARAAREALAAARADLAPTAVPAMTSAERGRRPAADATQATEEARAALAHYLRLGLLPWTLAGLEPEQAHQFLVEAAAEALSQALADAGIWARLLPDGPLHESLGARLRWLALLPLALRQRWLAAVPEPARLDAWTLARWRQAMDGDGPAACEWQALWLAWPLCEPRERAAIEASKADVPPALLAWLGIRRDSVEAAASALAAALLRSLAIEPTSQPLSPMGARSALPPPPPQTATELADETALSQIVPLAGLVLLHPFLPRFLAGCGVLAADGRSVLEAQLPRACGLLHLLAQGETEALPEHQLPLVKLLLGRAPDVPLSAAVPSPDEADKQEAQALLDAVRGHWSALKGSGSESLRLSFLQRRGLLRRIDAGWQLHLQAEPFDLLLGLLPWSLGLFKLPWMAEPLQVEWPVP